MDYMNRIEEIIAKANGSLASKASISTSTGIVAYDLEPLLKQVYPVLTPFRNSHLPRRTSPRGGTSFNAKLLTSIATATGGIGIAEGKRGVDVSLTEQDVAVSYRTVGQDGSTTFEAEDAADSFDDARAILMTTLLNDNLIEEEQLSLFANGGNIMRAGSSAQTALGTCSTPVLTNNGGGAGTVAAATYNVWCVALTYFGMRWATIAGGLPGQIARTTNDGFSQTINGGNSIVSAASNAITLGGLGSLAATVPAVRGAFGYAWYVGTSKATAALAALTFVNSMVLTAPAAGTQLANDAKVASDFSIDSYVYDGLITQVMQSTSGAYVKSLDGANLTASGAAGITEIDVALKTMYDTYRLGPDFIYVDSGTKRSIDAKIIGGGGAPLFRFNQGADAARGVIGNETVKQYYNIYTGKMIPIEVHPYFPLGTVFGAAEKLPYATPNVPVPYRLQARSRDWTEYEWPLVTRTRGRGQYGSFGLISYTPWSNFLLQNVGQA
jgi:hypothetical protein